VAGDDFVVEKLPTGQQLITEHLDHLRSVCVGFWIPAGSREESADLAGVTHFIEHLLFKGSTRFSAQQVAEVFDGIGGELNAATSKEYVVVYGRFLQEHLETAMEVLLDILRRPTFADLDREREVILEEIAMYEDSPQEIIHDVFTSVVFGDHPLGRPILGTAASIAGMAETDIRHYHQDHFDFPNMVVAAAGYVDHERIRSLLLECADTGAQPPAGGPDGQPGFAQSRVFVEKDTEQMHVCLGGRGLPRGDSRRYVLSVLDSVFGGSLSSRLFQEIREKRGLVYSVYSFATMYRDTGLTGVYFGSRPDRVKDVVEIVFREIEKLRTAPVGEEELARAREHLKGRIILGFESTSSRMTRLGKGLLCELEILSLDEIARRIDSVTGEEVMELAQELLDQQGLCAAGIGTDVDSFTQALP
jgi:predicted Zn-dependent peptidase